MGTQGGCLRICCRRVTGGYHLRVTGEVTGEETGEKSGEVTGEKSGEETVR